MNNQLPKLTEFVNIDKNILKNYILFTFWDQITDKFLFIKNLI